MIRFKTILVIVFSLAPANLVFSQSFSARLGKVEALGDLTNAPAFQEAKDFDLEADPSSDVRAIYYDGLDWKGKPTKVFAILGLPKERQGKVPAIVLVHGGGGKAFPEWVKNWTDRGYAAISMSVEGHRTTRQSHAWPGPERDGIYHDSSEPLTDQWMYHAVADTILANSLMRSLPEVDASKVGLMGISWGGVITSTVVGIDDRFAFAIPTYGCGDLATAANQYGRALGNNDVYQNVWDPMLRLDKATMPMLWFSWPQDKHFPMNHFAASYQAAAGDRMVSLVPNMRHGHGPPWRRPESYAFANSVIETGRPWCTQTTALVNDGRAKVRFSSTKPIENGDLVWTADVGVTGLRKWVETPATLQTDGLTATVSADLPPNATAWFINVISGDLIASSDYQSVTSDSSTSLD
ncbi:Acetyl xylan esterase (AXE1) [Neorhodopirellula lusitana]|uniref:Acetyl xylan esterase (AXE1) n=1 Tax=Neorhodopirellula lusitana TaxID=445327 RepID=A0ABY1PYB4_9BACT|nr:acetylxylan esterase [Neorhodopirellula lusitana]SMP51791.1 Acetyl xylan esterase (AXE1) [Neorhodopirellula lusitana]